MMRIVPENDAVHFKNDAVHFKNDAHRFQKRCCPEIPGSIFAFKRGVMDLN
jgi:hypothetical protein